MAVRIAPLILFAGLAAGAVLAQESPFSQSSGTAPPSPQLAVTLGDIMSMKQIRHHKLWLAGRAANWELAEYEIQQLRSTLVRSATLYLNIPIDLVMAADAPLESMQNAVKARDGKAFTNAYSHLTASCNACHMAGGVGFIRMVIPRASAFGNQDFAPHR